MKRITAFGLAIICCLAILAFSVPTRAGAAPRDIHINDLDTLDSDYVFTKDQVIALIQEAYDRGYKDGKKGISSADSVIDGAVDYVLNTNTMKFHYPDCRSIEQIKDKNRLDFDGSREEVIEMGYAPCKNCNP